MGRGVSVAGEGRAVRSSKVTAASMKYSWSMDAAHSIAHLVAAFTPPVSGIVDLKSRLLLAELIGKQVSSCSFQTQNVRVIE